MRVKSIISTLAIAATLASCAGGADQQTAQKAEPGYFPFMAPKEKPNIELSAATIRMYDNYGGVRPEDNELYTNFKYTKIEGLDYNGGDGTVSRRDPSRVIKANGKYYIYYTCRKTKTRAMGIAKATDEIPSTDWDLAEVWYATSKDGFTWEEQGVAVPRPPKPEVGWRAVCTPDIFVWNDKYYLYYQAFSEISGTRGDDCPVSVSVSDSPEGPFIPTGKKVIENGPEGTWDQYSIHDPYPVMFKGKIWLYYKSDYNTNENSNEFMIRGIGVATADNPLGPFTKEPKNPVINSGHEVCVFPFDTGLGCIAIRDGHERNTIQYSENGIDFYQRSTVAMPPVGAGPYMPDAFTGPEFSNGITWGVCHNKHLPGHSILLRFDCDLSLDYYDKLFDETELFETPEEQYRQALSPAVKKARMEEFAL